MIDIEDEEKDEEDWNSVLLTDDVQLNMIKIDSFGYSDECAVKVKNDNSRDKESCLGSEPVSRLALNDHKAGMEGLDKEKINKIIHDVSKGSKFYENEKKKEKRVLEKIEAMKIELKQFTCVDHKRALVESNKIIADLNKGIDLSRTLVHIDMDAFYAAVEMRDNPLLKNVPMAVGSTGMLSTSNYAARKFGVRAAMPGFIGCKLCPQLIIVPLHFDKYRQVSSEVRKIFSEYDPNYLPMSLDEAYLDLTEYMKENYSKYNCLDNHNKDVIEIIVNEIRTKIFEKTQLTASAGIGPNTMLSKVCSDMNKPNGQYYLKPDFENIKSFMKDLSIRKISGIGRVSEQMLKSVNVEKCGDLLENRSILYLLFSESSFRYFMEIAFGKSPNNLVHGERKSMSAERTFNNVKNKETLLDICQDLCKNVEEDLAKEELKGFNVTLKYKLSSFVTKTRSKTVRYPVSTADELFKIAKELLLKEIQSYGANQFELRLMGIRVSNFSSKECRKQHTLNSMFSNNSTYEIPSNSCSSTMQEDHFLSSTKSNDIIQTKFSDTLDVNSSSKCVKTDIGFDMQIKSQCPICEQPIMGHGDSMNIHIDKCLMKNDGEVLTSDRRNSNSHLLYESSESVLCPICKKPQQNEEFSLNSHIDHCLIQSDESHNEGSFESAPLHNAVDTDDLSLKNRLSNHFKHIQHNSTKEIEDIICPICGNVQQNNELSLNAHIDVCLTKQTIRKIVSEQEIEMSHSSAEQLKLNKDRNVNRQSHKRKINETFNSSKKVTLHDFWEKK